MKGSWWVEEMCVTIFCAIWNISTHISSYCNYNKYLEISPCKHKLQQILKDEESKMNSQWTMQELLSTTCCSTWAVSYWADDILSSMTFVFVNIPLHTLHHPATKKAYTERNLKNIGLVYVVHQLRKIQSACPFWSIKKEEKNKDRASVPCNL